MTKFILRCLTTLAVVGTSAAFARDPVVVLTSYPEEVFAKFEAAFERAHPDIDVTFVWRMPHDAMGYLRDAGRGKVDVYWSPAYRNFVQLAADGALQPLPADLDGLPDRIGPFRLTSTDGRFTATELAGFGIAVHPGTLAAAGIAPPREWSDLADARFAGRVLMPIASRVGFAPTLYDGILQSHGWQRGWSLVQRIAANARLADAGGSFLEDELLAGRGAVALTIDFFARAAIANGAPLDFRYPSTGGISAAQVGVVRDAPNPATAERFTRFLLSDPGQALLVDRDIRKLPVRPSAYRDSGGWNPFAAADDAPLRYDVDLGVRRSALVSAMFDVLVTERHANLRSMWEAVRAAESRLGPTASSADRARLDEAIRLLEALPVSADEARDPALTALFDRRRRDPSAAPRIAELEAGWRDALARNAAAAARLLAP